MAPLTDPITEKYTPFFEVVLEEGETVIIAGIGQSVTVAKQYGRGQGEGVMLLTDLKLVFRFENPMTNARFQAYPLEAIVSAKDSRIIIPGMRELKLGLEAPHGIVKTSYYLSKYLAKQIAKRLTT